MPNDLFRYPLDRTGTSRDNLVLNEQHKLSNAKMRVFVPTNGAFYTESVVVRDMNNGQVLRAGEQYRFGNFFKMATEDLRKEVASVVVISDQSVSNSVAIDYQVVGGLYGFSNAALAEQIRLLSLDNRPVEWGNVFNKPDSYPAAPHLHHLADTFGYEYLVEALNQLRFAIQTGDEGSHTAIYNYIDTVEARLRALVGTSGSDIAAHVIRTDNPHRVTAAQVGTYTKQEIDTKDTAVRKVASDHIALRNNPHGVTAAQVGAYTKAETNNAISIALGDTVAKLNNHVADKSNPHGVTPSQIGAYTKLETDNLVNNVQTALNTFSARRNNPHAVTATQVGAYNKTEADAKIKAGDDALRTLLTGSATGTKLTKAVVPISTDRYNAIRWQGNGLYYGTQPAANLVNVYVDNKRGADTAPTLDNGAGSKSKPFKTLKFAMEVSAENVIRTIYLHEHQIHELDCADNYVTISNANFSFYPYGPNTDSLSRTGYETIYENPAIFNSPTTILFKGCKIFNIGDGYGVRASGIHCNGVCTLNFHGLRIVRNIGAAWPTAAAVGNKVVYLSRDAGIISGANLSLNFTFCRFDTDNFIIPQNSTSFPGRAWTDLPMAMFYTEYDKIITLNLVGTPNTHFTGTNVFTNFSNPGLHTLAISRSPNFSIQDVLNISYRKGLDVNGRFVNFSCNYVSPVKGYTISVNGPTYNSLMQYGHVWYQV